jgi:hypothetical protein
MNISKRERQVQRVKKRTFQRMVFKGTDAFFALKECSIINTIISNFTPIPSSPRLHRLRPNGGRRQ